MYCVSYTTVRIDSAEILSVQLPAKRSAAAIGLDQNHHPWDVDKKVPKHIPAAEARRKTGRKMGAKMGREEERPPSQAAPASLHSLSLSLPTGDGEREEEANSTRAFRLTALLSLPAYVGSDPTLCAGNCIARTSIVPPTFGEKEFFCQLSPPRFRRWIEKAHEPFLQKMPSKHASVFSDPIFPHNLRCK